ncbi:response regulator, partial [Thioclava sp. BHET1]
MTELLIVEDEPRLRIDLIDYLSLRGLEAEGVGCLEELEDRLATGPMPRVLLLDVGLPDGNGFEIAARLRQTRDCGIIML